MSALDTPARAARAERPQTRNWRRLLSDAVTKSETAAKHRAQLRRHLEAAAELAARRRAPHAPLRVLEDTSATWEKRLEALKAIADEPLLSSIRVVAKHLPRDIADLRSMLVVQAADTTVAVKEFLTDEEALAVFNGAAAGVAVTKKVMADARSHGALAVVEGRTKPEFWEKILGKVEEEQPAVRKLVVEAVEVLAKNGENEFVKASIIAVLSKAAPDRSADVREAAKKLFRGYATKHGEAEAKSLMDSLPREAQERLTVKKKVLNRKSVKQMMKERRAALKKGKRPAEEPKMGDAKRIALNDQENLENAEIV